MKGPNYFSFLRIYYLTQHDDVDAHAMKLKFLAVTENLKHNLFLTKMCHALRHWTIELSETSQSIAEMNHRLAHACVMCWVVNLRKVSNHYHKMNLFSFVLDPQHQDGCHASLFFCIYCLVYILPLHSNSLNKTFFLFKMKIPRSAVWNCNL